MSHYINLSDTYIICFRVHIFKIPLNVKNDIEEKLSASDRIKAFREKREEVRSTPSTLSVPTTTTKPATSSFFGSLKKDVTEGWEEYRKEDTGKTSTRYKFTLR